jgi:hypothetical protein
MLLLTQSVRLEQRICNRCYASPLVRQMQGGWGHTDFRVVIRANIRITDYPLGGDGKRYAVRRG